jgi:hypothetical protein
VTSLSLVQRSPTDCGASLCVIKKPRGRGGHSPRWAAEAEMMMMMITIIIAFVGKSSRLCNNRVKYGRSSQATVDNMAHVD